MNIRFGLICFGIGILAETSLVSAKDWTSADTVALAVSQNWCGELSSGSLVQVTLLGLSLSQGGGVTARAVTQGMTVMLFPAGVKWEASGKNIHFSYSGSILPNDQLVVRDEGAGLSWIGSLATASGSSSLLLRGCSSAESSSLGF